MGSGYRVWSVILINGDVCMSNYVTSQSVRGIDDNSQASLFSSKSKMHNCVYTSGFVVLLMHFVSVVSPPIKICNHLQKSNGYLLVYVINLYNNGLLFISHIITYLRYTNAKQ